MGEPNNNVIKKGMSVKHKDYGVGVVEQINKSNMEAKFEYLRYESESASESVEDGLKSEGYKITKVNKAKKIVGIHYTKTMELRHDKSLSDISRRRDFYDWAKCFINEKEEIDPTVLKILSNRTSLFKLTT